MTSSETDPFYLQKGFTLLELSIVLLIVSLLSAGLLQGLSNQRNATAWREIRQQLESTRESLLGFAISHGRLPCPAKGSQRKEEVGSGHEDCSLVHGVIPWATLGLPETDPWGQRLTYFASGSFTRAPASGELAGFTLATGLAPDNSGLADISNLGMNGSNRVAIDLAAVIVSHGKRSAGGFQPNGNKLTGALNEEAENADADLSFISDTITADFDDQLTWISPDLLKARLLAAGKLP